MAGIIRSGTGWLALGAGLACLAWRVTRPAPIDLQGRSVLITGGSRGLGLLMAEAFADEGCRVAICARDREELARAAARLRKRGAEVADFVCDVSDADQVEIMVEQVAQRFGGIDILVNNAGIIQVGPFEAMTLDDFERSMDTIFWGALYATKAALPGMQRRGGNIVNITSIGGKVPVPHLLPYDAAKFALVGLSEGLRAELRSKGVLVTTVVPGLMRTGSPFHGEFKGDSDHEFTWFSLASATPLTTMSAARAARRIVEATRRGEAEVTLGWQAKGLRLFHGVFPSVFTEVAGAVQRILPGDTSREAQKGYEIATPLVPSRVTALMNRAAQDNNELGGPLRG